MGVAGQRGFDPARRVVRRKRHVMTDTDGRMLLAAVSPANLHDSHGGVGLLPASRRPWPFLARAFADQAYAGERVGKATLRRGDDRRGAARAEGMPSIHVGG